MSKTEVTTSIVSSRSSWRRMLRARMVRNAAAQVARESDGTIAVMVSAERPRWMVPPLRWMVPFKPQRTLRLDKLGSRVWDLCDGQCTVEDIIDRFAARHELTFHEARVSVTSYLKELIARGALVVVIE